MTHELRTASKPARSPRLDSHAETGRLHETFTEFTFEAAHETPPYSTLHGHSFRVTVYLEGLPEPVFGWTHNLTEVEQSIQTVKAKVDHQFLNRVAGLEVPTLENITKWMWHELESHIPGVSRVLVRRGCDGQAEGCVYGRAHP